MFNISYINKIRRNFEKYQNLSKINVFLPFFETTSPAQICKSFENTRILQMFAEKCETFDENLLKY